MKNGIIEARNGTKKPSLSALKPTKEDSMSLTRKCSVANCTNAFYAKNFCKTHYNYHRRAGLLKTKQTFRSRTGICSVPDCGKKHRGGGYCQVHYMRVYQGLPLHRDTKFDPRPAIIEGDVAKIPLGIKAKDGYALVDVEFSYLDKYKWNMAKRNCVVRDKGDKLHHEIVGKPPKGFVVDHINRNTRDNRKSNLRFVTNTENTRNISMQKNNTSGYRGVWRAKNDKWVSNIKVNYKKLSLGTYTNIEDAAKAYNAAAIKYFGEFAVLNEIQEKI